MGNECALLYDSLRGYGLLSLIVLACLGIGIIWALHRPTICASCEQELSER